eukprot:scaffold2092_cov155-Skeletonema_dohrnii-CCMP3373.AAC.4
MPLCTYDSETTQLQSAPESITNAEVPVSKRGKVVKIVHCFHFIFSNIYKLAHSIMSDTQHFRKSQRKSQWRETKHDHLTPQYILAKKRYNQEPHTPAEISWFIEQFTQGHVKDYQMTAWLMAI